jgi:hypothetical protein
VPLGLFGARTHPAAVTAVARNQYIHVSTSSTRCRILAHSSVHAQRTAACSVPSTVSGAALMPATFRRAVIALCSGAYTFPAALALRRVVVPAPEPAPAPAAAPAPAPGSPPADPAPAGPAATRTRTRTGHSNNDPYGHRRQRDTVGMAQSGQVLTPSVATTETGTGERAQRTLGARVSARRRRRGASAAAGPAAFAVSSLSAAFALARCSTGGPLGFPLRIFLGHLAVVEHVDGLVGAVRPAVHHDPIAHTQGSVSTPLPGRLHRRTRRGVKHTKARACARRKRRGKVYVGGTSEARRCALLARVAQVQYSLSQAVIVLQEVKIPACRPPHTSGRQEAHSNCSNAGHEMRGGGTWPFEAGSRELGPGPPP